MTAKKPKTSTKTMERLQALADRAGCILKFDNGTFNLWLPVRDVRTLDEVEAFLAPYASALPWCRACADGTHTRHQALADSVIAELCGDPESAARHLRKATAGLPKHVTRPDRSDPTIKRSGSGRYARARTPQK